MSKVSEATVKKAASSVREVQETVSRISERKSVLGVMILNSKGDILQSTWNPEDQLQHAKIVSSIVRQARSLLNEDDPLSVMTIRSLQREIFVAPDGEYLLVVLQNPHQNVSE